MKTYQNSAVILSVLFSMCILLAFNPSQLRADIVPQDDIRINYPTGVFERSINIGEETRSLAFYVPETYDNNIQYSLLIGMQTDNNNQNQMRDLLLRTAQNLKVILVCPEDPKLDCSIISSAIIYTKNNYNINSEKIILSGCSSSSCSVFDYAYNHNIEIKGYIGISPTFPQIENIDYSIIRKLPMGVIIGTADTQFETTDLLIKNLLNNGGNIKYITQDGVEHFESDPYFKTDAFKSDLETCVNYIINSTSSIIDKNLENNDLSVSLNLNSESAMIKANLDINERVILNIYDIFGNIKFRNQLFENNFGGYEFNLNISNYLTGTYFAVLTTKTKNISKPFIIN